jgi:hypothetical protein
MWTFLMPSEPKGLTQKLLQVLLQMIVVRNRSCSVERKQNNGCGRRHNRGGYTYCSYIYWLINVQGRGGWPSRKLCVRHALDREEWSWAEYGYLLYCRIG